MPADTVWCKYPCLDTVWCNTDTSEQARTVPFPPVGENCTLLPYSSFQTRSALASSLFFCCIFCVKHTHIGTQAKVTISYQGKRVFSCFPGLKQARIPKTVVRAVVRTVPATVFAFSGSEMQATFWVSLLGKECGKMMSGRI